MKICICHCVCAFVRFCGYVCLCRCDHLCAPMSVCLCAWVQVPEAVALYREVLMSVEEHEKRKQFQTDTLPHLHTLHNLKEVLATRPPGVHPTLRDDQLGKQVSGQAPRPLPPSWPLDLLLSTSLHEYHNGCHMNHLWTQQRPDFSRNSYY